MGVKQVVHPKFFSFNIVIDVQHVQHGQPFKKLFVFSVGHCEWRVAYILRPFSLCLSIAFGPLA